MEKIPFHRFAEIFPLLEGAEFRELVEDVRENGLREPVVLFEGEILDGRNRYRAAQAAQVDVRFEPYAGADALGFVVSKNLRRRHLDASQRAMAAADIARLKQGARTDLSPVGERSQADAAALMGVGKRSVERAVEVRDHGAPVLRQAVQSGKVKVSAAADIATLPEDEQVEIVARGPQEILAKAKEIRRERSQERRTARLGRIAGIAAGNGPLDTATKFPVLYIDPPTRFEAGDSDRSAENHYPTMTEEEIAALPVGELATPDAVIFMWTTVPWLRKSMRILQSWGFEYVSAAFWDKQVAGKGFWWRNQVEVVITATRGNMPAPPPELVLPGFYSARKTEHSSKPAWFRLTIGRYYPSLPKVELFARGEAPPGWVFWGNQASNAALQPDEKCAECKPFTLLPPDNAAQRDELEMPAFLKRPATTDAEPAAA